MRGFWKPAFAVLACVLGMSAAGADQVGNNASRPVPAFIKQNKGKVVVALLGMPGCPGTEQATLFLADFAKTKPDGVVLCRVDVPLRGKTLDKAAGIDPRLTYLMDADREIADSFEFFFYPTLYIVDKDGLVRFSGGYTPAEVKAMVAGILSEPPGADKKIYTPPLAKVGDVIADFRIAGAGGQETSLNKLCSENGAILFFSSTTCGFSISALDDLERLKKDFKEKKFGYVVVSFGQDAGTAKDVYQSKSPGSVVVIDSDKSISTKSFGVSAVPFYYVLDKNRQVIDRSPFVYESAKAAVAKVTGTAGGSGCGATGATGAG